MSAQELTFAEVARIRNLAPSTEWAIKAVNAFSKASTAEQTEVRIAKPATARELLEELISRQPGRGGGAGSAATGVITTVIQGGPDTSMEYIRRVLVKPYPLGVTTNNVGGGGVPMSAPAAAAAAAVKAATAVKAAACSGLLAEPLDAKLPVLGALVQGALLGDSRLGEYVTVETGDGLAAWAHKLRLTTTAALSGMHLFISDKLGGSKTMTTVKMALLVDATLSLALENLGLYTSMDRAAADESYGAAEQQLRPDFLLWVGNALLFKGEEHASDMQSAIAGLWAKMATPWIPALLPDASMPCMFAYAAAGNSVKFFAITSSGGGGSVRMTTISEHLDIGTPFGRIQVVHHILKILQVLVAYAPHVPSILMPLGGVRKEVGPLGNVLRSVTLFPEFVRKSVDLSQQDGSTMDYQGLADMYRALGGVRCPNLVRLHCRGGSSGGGSGGGIHLQPDGKTVVLYLEPVGLPLQRAPPSEADLRRAVRDVLAGVAALHAAGFVHRDIKWQNVIRLPAAAAFTTAASQQPADTYVLIDLEHAAPADFPLDCGQPPPYQLPTWPAAHLLDPATGRYTRQSDLCMLAAALMSYLPFSLSDSGCDLRQRLVTRQLLSAEAALQHEWLLQE
ncbi:hypothetical protein CHLRE_07g352250v5 [Chlamydomonas reinhardtii]|uniref:Protein kinase domain-containing protein n=1 Tax=Chlamydomonas reinhardtii TaxID=3055 RepID=A0A2K3DLD5_CHLRE|nr:uncharacterized protein CHLRE_07g352250v5 [Chlamydomonas reinhardtii]PNW81349.1 hypothetical protein CHLRE_07g352250v5 [Chlamydomonas reinhardtii]